MWKLHRPMEITPSFAKKRFCCLMHTVYKFNTWHIRIVVTVTLHAIRCISYRAIHLVHTRTHILWLPYLISLIKIKRWLVKRSSGSSVVWILYRFVIAFPPYDFTQENTADKWSQKNCTICKDQIFASRPWIELLKLHRKDGCWIRICCSVAEPEPQVP